jgi:hypothetical protein
MVFNPLQKVEEAQKKGQFSSNVYQLILKRFHIVTEGIERIEKASGLIYPYYYIEPTLVISASQIELSQFGIFFARTIPVINNSRLNITIQISAALVAYGLLGTVHAILAHEFMHYLEIMNRVMRMNVLSDELSGTLFERTYVDSSSLLQHETVFWSDSALVNHIKTKFPDGFKDLRLEEKVIKNWINIGLPVTKVSVDTNIIKIPIETMGLMEIDPHIKKKLMNLRKGN